jgi:hypothetical protein
MILVHLTILTLTGALILFSDWMAFTWWSGRVQTLDLKTLTRAHYGVAAGLTLMILTGSFMALGRVDELLYNPAFWIKMTFVGILIINSFVIGSHLKTVTSKPYVALSDSERMWILISGAVSTIGWLGTITAALFLGD